MPIESFQELLNPLDSAEFLESIYCNEPVHIKGAKDRFAYLLTWEALNRMVLQHRLNGPRVRLANDGQVAPENEYTQRVNIDADQLEVLKLESLSRLIRQDYTMVIDSIDETHEPISDLCRMTEFALGTRVFVDAFASWQQKKGFALHWDPEEVFLIQVTGTKYWRLYKPERSHPVPQDKATIKRPPDGEPAWEGAVCAGDILYMPGGWWHEGVPTGGEPALHLSMSAFPPTGLNYVNEIVSKLCDETFFRAPVPQFASKQAKKEYTSRFRKNLADAAAHFDVDEFLHNWDTKMTSRFRLSLPWSAVPDSPLPSESDWVHWLPPRPVELQESKTGTTFEANGTRFELPSERAALLRDLMQNRKVQFGQFCAKHPDVSVADFVMHLLSEHLVAVSESRYI